MARHTRTHLVNDSMESTGLARKHLTRQEFGRRLWRLIREREWNQSELARRANMPRDSISTYVNGKCLPTPPSLKKIANALGISPDELYPNQAEAAIEEDIADVEFRRSPGDPTVAWLRINRLMPYKVGLQILGLLEASDDSRVL